MFFIDQLQFIAEDISAILISERKQYSEFYELVEEYLKKNKQDLVLGGRIASSMILEEEKTPDAEMFCYEMYSESALPHANSLANLFAQKVGDSESTEKIISMRTMIPNRKYSVFVNTRMIVVMRQLPEKSMSVVNPQHIKGTNIIPAEILLLELYRKLYTPGEADNWGKYLHDENSLFQYLKQRKSIIKGGATPAVPPPPIKTRILIGFNIIKKFVVNNSSVVLLGEHAFHLISSIKQESSIIQIIASCSVEECFDKISSIVLETAGEGFAKHHITINMKNMHVMGDFRLKRYTIKLGEKEICYIYNSAEYELIPFGVIYNHDRKEFIQTGNPFVLIRFLLVELWFVRWLKSTGKIEKMYAKKRIDNMLKRLIDLRLFMTLQSENNQNTITTISDGYFGDKTSQESGLLIFQPDEMDYVGVYVSESTAVKKITKTAKFYADYFPQKYFREHNEYRVI